MNTCTVCGKEFYSDTEYEMHMQGEQNLTVIKESIAVSKQAAFWIQQVVFQLQMMNILNIMTTKKVTLQEAAKMYTDFVDLQGTLAREHKIGV